MRSWIRKPLGTVIVAAAIALSGGGIYAATTIDGGEAPASTANLWVNTTAGAAPARCVTACAYDSAKAYGSFTAAYNAAQGGDLVLVRNPAGGDDYGPQTIPDGTKAVTFRSEAGKAETGQLIVSAAGVLVEDLIVENRGDATDTCGIGVNGALASCGEDATYDGVEIDGLTTCAEKRHGIRYGGDGFTFRNGEIRNVKDEKGAEISGADMVLDNVYFHDILVRNECGQDIHNECVYVQESPNLIIRNSRFVGCPTMAIYFTNWSGGGTYSGYQLIGNEIGYTLDSGGNRHVGCAVDLGSFRITSYVGIKVKYNTIDTCVGASTSMPNGGGNEMVGNIGGFGCYSQFTYRYNVGDACSGTGNVTVDPGRSSASLPDGPAAYGWADASAFDYTLAAGSGLIGAGDPTDYPTTDRLGTPRSSPPDVGAYERP